MEKLKELRTTRKIRQKEFAKYMNVAQNTVSRWESGERLMDSETLVKVADYFGVSIDYLVGRDIVEVQPRSNKIASKNARLLHYYSRLNDIGKNEANKRIEELTLIPMYCNGSMPIAAHNDSVIDEKELKLMQEDIDDL